MCFSLLLRCGDLNVSHQSIDLANPSSNAKTAGYTKEEREDFSKILSDGFIDSCILKNSLCIFLIIYTGNSFFVFKPLDLRSTMRTKKKGDNSQTIL